MKRKTFGILSLIASGGMLLFTFVTLAWRSDLGFQWGLEIPVGTEKGILSTVADFFWMASPFLAFIASALLLLFPRGNPRPPLILMGIAALSYPFLQMLLAIEGKELHASLWLSLILQFLLGLLALGAAYLPEIRRAAASLTLFDLSLEIALVLLSFLFHQKLSQFYFGEKIWISRLDYIFFSYLVISILLYHLFFLSALVLHLRAAAKEELSSENIDSDPPEPPASEPREETEEDREDAVSSSISLQDLGLER